MLLPLLLILPAIAADAPVATAKVGVGLPELLHVEGGWRPRDDLEVGLRAGTVVFNVLVGPTVQWQALGAPRGHGLWVGGAARINPFADPVGIESGGETLRAMLEPAVSWRWVGEAGLLLDARAAALLYLDDGPAIGPDLTVGVGWAFGG